MPYKVYQDGQLMGTVPTLMPESRSFIFQVRPNDFKPERRDGETVLIADRMIGPGDFACIKGFEAAEGSHIPRDTPEADFMDAMARMAGLK